MSRRLWFVGFLVLLVAGSPLLAQAGKGGAMKFEIYRDAAKEYRWRLKAANGKVLATAGQGYKAKADCTRGVERLQGDLSKYKFEVYQDKAKEYRWRLRAPNGQIVASASEGYKAKADCEKAIESIKKGAAGAKVEDMT